MSVEAEYGFEYEARHAVIAVRFGSALTDALCVRFYREAPRYLAGQSVRAVLIDFSAVTAFDVSVQTVRHLGGLRALLPGPVPRVVIAPQDVAFGLLRLFQHIAIEKRQLQVYRTAEAASDALGLNDAHFEVLPAPLP